MRKNISKLIFGFTVIFSLTGCSLGAPIKSVTVTAESSPETALFDGETPTPIIIVSTTFKENDSINSTVTPEASGMDFKIVRETLTPAYSGKEISTQISGDAVTQTSAVGADSVSLQCYSSSYLADVSIPDGTKLKTGEKFYKIWRIQNTGSCAWGKGFGLILRSGDRMEGTAVFFSENDSQVMPGGVVDIGIQMQAPGKKGAYSNRWGMVTNFGYNFGADFTVVIDVER